MVHFISAYYKWWFLSQVHQTGALLEWMRYDTYQYWYRYVDYFSNIKDQFGCIVGLMCAMDSNMHVVEYVEMQMYSIMRNSSDLEHFFALGGLVSPRRSNVKWMQFNKQKLLVMVFQ